VARVLGALDFRFLIRQTSQPAGYLFLAEFLEGRISCFVAVSEEETMAVYEETLEANQQYARSFGLAHLEMPPARKLAVVACMDARLTVEQFLGLKTGEAHIIRNAGGLATDDALRSLIISTRLLGTRTIYVIEHTDCGMLTFQDEQLRQQLKAETGKDTSHLRFHTFTDLEANLRTQLRHIRENPFLPRDIELRGFIYDVRSGRLREVGEEGAETRAASMSSR